MVSPTAGKESEIKVFPTARTSELVVRNSVLGRMHPLPTSRTAIRSLLEMGLQTLKSQPPACYQNLPTRLLTPTLKHPEVRNQIRPVHHISIRPESNYSSEAYRSVSFPTLKTFRTNESDRLGRVLTTLTINSVSDSENTVIKESDPAQSTDSDYLFRSLQVPASDTPLPSDFVITRRSFQTSFNKPSR